MKPIRFILNRFILNAGEDVHPVVVSGGILATSMFAGGFARQGNSLAIAFICMAFALESALCGWWLNDSLNQDLERKTGDSSD